MEAVARHSLQLGSKQQTPFDPLDLFIPIPIDCSKKNISSAFISSRDHLLATQRVNRSQAGKNLADIKQMLSKSLFNKDRKKTLIQKQKLRNYLREKRLQNLPISPQTEQNSYKNLLKFLKMKNIGIQPKLQQRNQRKRIERLNKDVSCPITSQDSFLKHAQNGQFNVTQQAQIKSNEDRELLDQKFNNLLQINFAEQGDLSLDIESRFASKGHKQNISQAEFIQPCLRADRAALHEKLLQEENLYIRQQLIIFGSIIEAERAKVKEYRSRVKTLKMQKGKVQCKYKQLQKQFLQGEENIYDLANQNNECISEMKRLRQQKLLVESKFSTLLRQYQLVATKLQEFQQQKYKEIDLLIEERNRQRDTLIEEIKFKDKDIAELNEIIQYFNSRSKKQKHKLSGEDKVNTSIDSNRQQGSDFQQQTSSICLSLAEAQSLKNIIQEKQQMFQLSIDNLKAINSENEQRYLKTIQQLKQNLMSLQKTKAQEIQRLQQHFSTEVDKLKSQNYQNNLTLSKQIADQQQIKYLLVSQIRQFEARLEQNLMQEEEEVEELLENCVNQLERQRHAHFLLQRELAGQRRANSLLSQEVGKLEKIISKQMYPIEDATEEALLID